MIARRSLLVLLVVLMTMGLSQDPAAARWGSTSSGPGRAASPDLATPGTLTASCSVLGSGRVTLTWVGNGTTWAGYEVRWGTSSTSGEITETTFTTPPLAIGVWQFTVRARKGSWVSSTSNTASRTVASVLGAAVCV